MFSWGLLYLATCFQSNNRWFRSDTLPLSSLCIQPGKSAWTLYVDAVCINYDGNVLDAAVIAMIAALKNSEMFYN